jgi:tetratricopeptide (TPR) repeat protein
MKIPIFVRPVVTLLFFGSITSSAQIASSDISACNPKLAQMLVEQQVGESKSVVARPKRIKILLRSADFLWPLDQPTARGYFIEAFTNAKEHFAEKGFERARVQNTGSGGSTSTSLPDLRSDVIRSVAKRDPELAKKFTNEVLAEFEKAERDGPDKTREQDDMLRLAGESAGTDPEFARHLYRRLMRYPLTQTWFWSLLSAARSDQSFADSIYAEALKNYQNESPSRLLYLSAYPFGAQTIFGRSRSSFSAAPITSFVPNVGLQRSFLDTFFARVASYTGDPEVLNRPAEKHSQPEAIYMTTAMSDIEPIIMERFPDMLQRFTLARAQANAALTAEMRKDMERLEESASRGGLTFEESIKELEEADSKGTLTDYLIAQILFQRRIRTEKQYAAYEPWLGKIKDENIRSELTSYFWYVRSELAIKEKRFAEAEKMAAKVPELDHRAVLLLSIAKIQLDSINEVGSVFDTLNAVSKLSRSAPDSVAKAQVLFSLVDFYERVNHSVALDELGEAVRVVNRLEDPDLFQNWVYRQITGKNFGFMASISLPGNNLEGMFTELGKKNFEMALANARGFDDKYFRTIAVIAIAKNCIPVKPSGTPKPKQ